MYVLLASPAELKSFGSTDLQGWKDLSKLQEFIEEEYKEGNDVENWKIFKVDLTTGHSPIVSLSVVIDV